VVDFRQKWAVEVSNGRFGLNASGSIRRRVRVLENVEKMNENRYKMSKNNENWVKMNVTKQKMTENKRDQMEGRVSVG
jgi:hypothetical protein